MKPKIYLTRRLPQSAWAELITACQVESWDHESTPPPYQEIKEKIQDKQGLLCLLTDRIDRELIEAAPSLKVISQCAVGVDNIDLEATNQHNIVVGNTPGVLTNATADFTFALLLAASRRLGEAIDYVRSGSWQTWGLTILLGSDVFSATLGIIGLGRIGRAVAKRARGFNMHVLYYDEVRQPVLEAELGVEYRSIDNLLRESDFVTLHVNLNSNTKGLINTRTLKLMKPGSILINTSRGPVVDSDALYQALKNNHIAYAALDVTDPEPLPHNHKLLSLPNLIITPHIASATVVSRNKMALMAVHNLIAGLRDKPLPHPVDLS